MRSILFCFAMAVTAGAAYGATTVVYPTGMFPVDVQNVQTALNRGGSVLLKATDRSAHPLAFNFGDPVTDANIPSPEHVVLVKDVSISGERIGSARTTINGGFSVIRSGDVAVKALIQGIKFERPTIVAFAITRSNGLSILNNEIDHVLPFLNGAGFTESSGIYVFNDDSAAPGTSTIAGQVIISGNYIHGLDGEFEFGFQADGVGANMIITDNTLELGQVVGDNNGDIDSEGIAVVRSSGPALISGNKMTVGNGTCYSPIALFGKGSGGALIIGNQISIAQQGNCASAIGVFGPNGPIQILGNIVTSVNPLVDGIILVGISAYGGGIDKALLAGNFITIHNSSFGGITLYGAVSNSNIDFNSITGDSAYALDALSSGDPSELCQSNKFLGNAITHYTASVSTIYLDTNTVNNVVRGPYATVIDNGTGNQVSH